MEIVAGMLLDDKEFIALKPEYVPGVLDILRSLARRETCACAFAKVWGDMRLPVCV